MTDEAKPLIFAGSSLKDLKRFPPAVRRTIGFALRFAQGGLKHPTAKPLKGFKGAGVLEVVENRDGNTYRAVYTVRFAAAVYVLHVFQKKSKKGTATPKAEMDLVKQRLKEVAEEQEE